VNVPGRELGGIHYAVPYLKQQNRRIAGDVILKKSVALAESTKLA